MKRWKWVIGLFVWSVVLSLCGVAAQAAGFAPTITAQEGEPDTVIEVSLPYDGSLGEIAAFRASVEYDPEAFEYLRPQYGEAIQEGTVTIAEQTGVVSGVYTASSKGPFLESGDSITFRFRVLEKAPAGSYGFFVSVFEIASPEPVRLYQDVDVSLSFRVLEPPSSDARLLSLEPDSGTLDPVFHPDCFVYSMTVPYQVDAVTFTAEPVAGALCRVNRKNLGACGSDTVFTITVTAEDGVTKNLYQIVVHREEEEKPILSGESQLLSLVPATGTLTPAFDPEQLTYSLTVPFEVTTMTFTAEASEGASYRVNRKNLGAGGSDTLFTITVTAEDGETKTIYQVTVHRQEKEEEEKPILSEEAQLLSLVPTTGTLTPAFDPDRLTYSLTVPFEVTTMTFTAEASEGASYRVNRKNLGAGGSDTLFTITVTAEDGETKTIYQVTVHRQEKQSTAGSDSTNTSGSSSTSSTGKRDEEDKTASGTAESNSSSEGEESSTENEQVLPVAGTTGDGPSSGDGGGTQAVGETGAGGIIFQNGSASLVPGMLAMLAFVLFCFLSGPLSKELAKRFPGKESPLASSEDTSKP